MSQNGNTSPEITASRQRIQTLLEEMPAENLPFLEQFLQLINHYNPSLTPPSEQKQETPYRYPTVAMPASSLRGWSQILEEGYEGDALADSEAIYDDF